MTSNSRTSTNRYGALAAEIYDLDKPVGRLPDTEFHLQRLQSETRPILEPGCGSGRTLAPLLQAGLNVTGFDQSPEMLERCRARCADDGLACTVDEQSLEDFHYDRKFGVVLLPVGTFTLIDDLAVARSVLRRFFNALEPDGALIIDLPSLAHLADTRPDRRRWTAANGDLLTLEGLRVATDWWAQRAESTYRYERWRDHRLLESEIEPMAQRFWGSNEFELMLASAGFRDVLVFGGYDTRRSPRSSDPVFTFEARRP